LVSYNTCRLINVRTTQPNTIEIIVDGMTVSKPFIEVNKVYCNIIVLANEKW